MWQYVQTWPSVGPHREAGPAAGVVRPGVQHRPVVERVERRALGRGDVGGRVVVVGVRDGDDRRAAADREDVRARTRCTGGAAPRRAAGAAGWLNDAACACSWSSSSFACAASSSRLEPVGLGLRRVGVDADLGGAPAGRRAGRRAAASEFARVGQLCSSWSASACALPSAARVRVAQPSSPPTFASSSCDWSSSSRATTWPVGRPLRLRGRACVAPAAAVSELPYSWASCMTSFTYHQAWL